MCFGIYTPCFAMIQERYIHISFTMAIHAFSDCCFDDVPTQDIWWSPCWKLTQSHFENRQATNVSFFLPWNDTLFESWAWFTNWACWAVFCWELPFVFLFVIILDQTKVMKVCYQNRFVTTKTSLGGCNLTSLNLKCLGMHPSGF